MNWKEIKEKCPKAWKKYVYEFINSELGEIDAPENWNRDLYDFFDENGI